MITLGPWRRLRRALSMSALMGVVLLLSPKGGNLLGVTRDGVVVVVVLLCGVVVLTDSCKGGAEGVVVRIGRFLDPDGWGGGATTMTGEGRPSSPPYSNRAIKSDTRCDIQKIIMREQQQTRRDQDPWGMEPRGATPETPSIGFTNWQEIVRVSNRQLRKCSKSNHIHNAN